MKQLLQKADLKNSSQKPWGMVPWAMPFRSPKGVLSMLGLPHSMTAATDPEESEIIVAPTKAIIISTATLRAMSNPTATSKRMGGKTPVWDHLTQSPETHDRLHQT
jgi:hypothetical protein